MTLLVGISSIFTLAVYIILEKNESINYQPWFSIFSNLILVEIIPISAILMGYITTVRKGIKKDDNQLELNDLENESSSKKRSGTTKGTSNNQNSRGNSVGHSVENSFVTFPKNSILETVELNNNEFEASKEDNSKQDSNFTN